MQLSPILNGAAGFVLLSFSIALGAYVRAVYASSTETYDKTITGQLEPLWKVGAVYTTDRLANLQDVQKNLLTVTKVMFVFVFLVSLRMIVFALNATSLESLRTPNNVLAWADLFLVLYLAVALLVSYHYHLKGSEKEREL